MTNDADTVAYPRFRIGDGLLGTMAGINDGKPKTSK